jgi:hypothetical protein
VAAARWRRWEIVKRRTHLFAGLCGALVLLALPAAASAQSCTSNKLGTYTYTNCSDGTSATTTQLGNYGYTTYSDGTTSTRTQLGNYGYTTNSNGTTATSTQLGGYGYTHYSDGTTATTTRIGDYIYTTFSDGSTVTTWSPLSTTTSTTVRPVAPVAPVAPPVYVPAPALPTAPSTDQGISLNVDGGGQKYLASGTFVKIDGSPAIYLVSGGQLHSFTTWPQFLNAGGKSDLSNVAIFSYISNNSGTLFGSPVQG